MELVLGITFQSEIIKSFKKYCRLGWNRLQDCYHGLHNLPRLLPRFTLKVFKILNQESDFQTCQLWFKISGFSEISGFSGIRILCTGWAIQESPTSQFLEELCSRLNNCGEKNQLDQKLIELYAHYFGGIATDPNP